MYFNTLIIMNEDTPGYGRKSRSPSGYCKLTMPNKVICYAQGLQQLPKGQIYRLYLMSQGKQKSVEVGMFQVGADGNKETRWTIEPANINNSGISAKEVDGALIVVDGEDIKRKTVPLLGFASEPYGWANLISLKVKQDPVPKSKAIIEPTPILKPEPEPELELEIEMEQVTELEASAERESEVGLEPKMEPVPGATIESGPELEPECELPFDTTLERLEWANTETALKDEINALKEEIKRLNRIIEAEELEKTRKTDTEINDFLGRFQKTHHASNDVIEKVFKQRIPMHPFQDSHKDIKWVRISHADLTSFPHLDHEWVNQPLIINACNDYKHLILGRDELGLTYYLGIPDVFQPDKNYLLDIERIERFTCRKKGPVKAGKVGYWIALI